MKIVIDVRVLMNQQYSGVPEYVYNLLQALFELDQTNQYLLYYNSSRQVSVPDFAKPNVRYLRGRIPNKILNYILFKFFRKPYLEKLIGEPFDLLWMPHLNFISTGHTPAILTVHDLSFLRYGEFFSWLQNLWHYFINAPRLIHQFSQIVAVSEHTKRDIVNLTGVAESKVTVIPGAVSADYHPLDATDPKLSKIRNKYQLPERFILTLSTIEPRKNLELLIKAYEQLRQAQPQLTLPLIIAGARGWSSGAVYNLATQSPFASDIRFLGYLDKADKNALYNLATVFIFPSLYEGFGLPVIEAMATGTPVIASWASSLSEVVAEAGILINPYDSQDLARALALVLNDLVLAENLRQSALSRASDYTWQKSAEQYLKLFNNSQK